MGTGLGKYGFLSEDIPLARLPGPFESWERIADDLPSIIKSGKLREKVDQLSLVTVNDRSLPDKQHWQRAYCVVSFISQAYICEDDQCISLPKQLAVPLVDVSSKLGLPPSPCYAAFILWNWRLKNPDEPVSTHNFKTALSFTGSEDEEWFYLIHIRIELAAASGVKAVVACIEAMKKNDEQKVAQCLNIVAECISDIISIMKEMRLKCVPDTFYNNFRKFLSRPAGGIKYEGTSDPEIVNKYPGASGVQSSIIPLFDIFLGIEYEEGEVKLYLDKMRWHMPCEHRQFLLEMSNEMSVREYAINHPSNNAISEAYDGCIEKLLTFRKEHIIMVTSYIIIPSGGQAKEGTGGSPLIEFLKEPKDKMKSYKLMTK